MTKPLLWLWRAVRIFLVVYAVLCLLLVVLQGRMLYFPQPVVESTPEDYGAHYAQVWIPGPDGAKLYGWWVPANNPAAPTLIYFHGNYGNVGSNAEHASRLARICCNVLIFDYRGYGRSTGPFPNEQRIYADAESAWNYVVSVKTTHPGNIILYGHSLGGGVAVEMAKRHPDVGGMILDSTFTSVADRALLDPLYHWFPVRLLVHQRFDSIHKITATHAPVLILAGTADTTIPNRMSQSLYEAAPGRRQIVLIHGGGHDNSAVVGGTKYTVPLEQFVSSIQSGSH
jgi:uncharacterized protein